MKYSTFEGMLGWSGGNTLLKRGQSVDDNHPIAMERPELFSDTPPSANIQAAPVVERATAAPGEIRNTPAAGPSATNRVVKGR